MRYAYSCSIICDGLICIYYMCRIFKWVRINYKLPNNIDMQISHEFYSHTSTPQMWLKIWLKIWLQNSVCPTHINNNTHLLVQLVSRIRHWRQHETTSSGPFVTSTHPFLCSCVCVCVFTNYGSVIWWARNWPKTFPTMHTHTHTTICACAR